MEMFTELMHKLGVYRPDTSSNGDLGPDFPKIRAHVLKRVTEAKIGEKPFYHTFIDGIFPDDFYEALHAHMISHKHGDQIQARLQDNPKFVNRRFNLVDNQDLIVRQFRAIFNDDEIRRVLFDKFYVNKNEDLSKIKIHKEFEYVFCEPDRFQNIHVDISPKFMSFVFYIPEGEVTPEAEERNATVLYDKDLKPQYAARFRRNSVCIFVPHFYSYHGFSSTIERDVLVMFYVQSDEMKNWKRIHNYDKPPFNRVLDVIESKLHSHPLIEYGADPTRIAAERAACRINRPNGRVVAED